MWCANLENRWRAVLLALVAAGCHYDPQIPEGVAACNGNSDCPTGYRCLPRPGTEDLLVCCKTDRCGVGPALDAAGGPSDAAVPGVDGGAERGNPGAIDGADSDGADAAAPPGDAVSDTPDDLLAPPDAPPDLPPPVDTAVPCPPSTGGPALVRAGTFCVDSTEVTNEQYMAFLTAKGGDVGGQPGACKWNSSYVPGDEGVSWPYIAGRASYPIVNVDWCDAFMFCNWAGKRLCGPMAWRDRPDFTCFQAGSETAAISRGVAAELGPLANTQGKLEVGPFAATPKP